MKQVARSPMPERLPPVRGAQAGPAALRQEPRQSQIGGEPRKPSPVHSLSIAEKASPAVRTLAALQRQADAAAANAGLRALHSGGERGTRNGQPTNATVQHKRNLQQIPTGRAGAPVQRYTIIASPKGQLSQDKDMIVTTQRNLYATADQIKDANTKLEATGPFGSMIKLRGDGGAKATDSAPGKSFVKAVPQLNRSAYTARMRAQPKSKHKDMKKQTAPKLELWADCRKSSEVVTGANTGMAAHDREVNIGGTLHPGYTGRLDRPSGIANDSFSARLSMQVYVSAIGPFLKKYKVKALDKDKLLSNFPELDAIEEIKDRKQWLIDTVEQSSSDVSIAERLYDSLIPEGKRAFHRDTKTNEYANPEIGDAYATVTEYGMPGFEESGDDWSFHWGGVVMKDSSDNVTLENLSVSDENVRNTNWFFAMYGTERGLGQTFHERQTGSGHHGNIATTVSVETIGSRDNRTLLSLRNQLAVLQKLEAQIGVDQRVPILKVAVDYNELAAKISHPPLTEYECLLNPEREFTPEDKAKIHTLKRRYIPV